MRILTAFAAGAIALTTAATAFAQNAFEPVAGDVYRWQNNFHFGLVVVHDTGVAVIDTINLDASNWLKDNLSEITDKPITHLIYSHSHGDHASGGRALEAGTVIAHANAPDAIDGVTVTERFDDTMTLDLGSKQIELTYLGPGHGTDLIAAVVRPENVGFIVDAAAPKRLPFRDFPGSNVDQWTDQVRNVEALDFEIFAPGHGNLGVKADATDARIYMENLRGLVLDGLNGGKSVDALVAELTLDEYKDWASYDQWREPNIRGMARYLTESGIAN